MKKFVLFFVGLYWLLFLPLLKGAYAVDYYKYDVIPQPCSTGGGSCPVEVKPIYDSRGETCVATYEDFKKDPIKNHFWVNDPEVTIQGHADERARQFLYWVINKNAIDSHPTITAIWQTTRNLAFFITIIIAAILGLGFVIGQKTNFQTGIKIWPSILKILLSLLYIAFSAALVISLIQLSEILMKFFIENLGGGDLFNISFVGLNQESNYTTWLAGCRDLNFRVQEAANTQLFLLKLTNITYYALGGILILRKVILWFLLFLSPFLAILIPFVFIRNIGWVWVGVFFQWLFYGPMMSLFLGSLTQLWAKGIPFLFDFSRAGTVTGYIFPTATNILYGGPAQTLSTLNNVNYIDTFAEYVITLIMLWAVIILPWFLLRSFRDYCCDGINASKNILLSIYDQLRGNPQPQPSPIPSLSSIGASLKISKETEVPIKVRLETIEEIKKTTTEDITRSLNISTKKLTDIAHIETNKQVNETVNKNLNYLANPTKAETPIERQKYMNLRTELFNRAIKNDQMAKQVLASLSSSKVEQLQRRQGIIDSLPKMVSVTHVVSYKVKLPQEKVATVTSSLFASIIKNQALVDKIIEKTQLKAEQIINVLNTLSKNMSLSSAEIIQKTAEETKFDREKISLLLAVVSEILQENKEMIATVAQKESLKPEEVERVVSAQVPIMTEPEKHIEETISLPPTLPLEEYESVKKMWQKQYEQGEIPLADNIKSRPQWVNQDVVFITNTLNKLLSTSEELRQEGLDDLGYILPIFLLNNLKGEELVVYLKAKLEAAKTVAEIMDREQAVADKLKAQAGEEFIDVATVKKQTKAKTMTMNQALEQK